MFQIKIYASNTDILDGNDIKKFPLITEVTALVDVLSIELSSLTGLYGGLEVSSETKNYWSGGEVVINDARLTFNPQTVPITFSDTNTDILSQWKAIIKKKFKWIDIKDYTYRPSGILSDLTKLIAVNLSSWQFTAENGNKNINIAFKERP